MHELDPTIAVTGRCLNGRRGPRLFAAVEEDRFLDSACDCARNDKGLIPDQVGHDGHIIGCTFLCVYDSPTGRKASVEDVVEGSGFRGQGIDRVLIEEIIGFARRDLAPLDLHLTSRPERVAANEMYRKLVYERRGDEWVSTPDSIITLICSQLLSD
jgi:Acetyltransferases